MATWQAIVGATTYSLSDGNPFKVVSITGIGNAPVRRLEERGPYQDGVTDTGYRLEPRVINLVLAVFSTSLSNADTNRDTLSAIFSPTGGATIYLRCTRDDSAVRQIDCYAVGLVDIPAERGERNPAGYQRVGVQLKAPNPIWYDPTYYYTNISGGVTAWHTAGGMIASADVYTWGTGISAGSAWPAGTIAAAGEPWSVVARTSALGATTEGLWGAKTESTQNAGARVLGAGTIQGTDGSLPGVFGAVVTGTAILSFISDNPTFSVYQNGTIVATAAGARGTAGLISQGSAQFGVWGSAQAVAGWPNTITHGAVYKKALTDQERDTIEIILDGDQNAIAAVTNAGTWDEYPTIVLNGPLNDPVITNQTTGETLDFTGATVAGSVNWTIDLRYGYKTVTQMDGSNQIAKLADTSDLSTFHLAKGANVILWTAGGTAADSAVSVRHYNRYVSV